MKKLSGFLFSVAVLFLFSTAHAQTQDTALARIDDKALVKKADVRLTEPTDRSEDRAIVGEIAAPQVKFIVPETKDRKSENSILETKAGPNGEDIQMDKNGYYYFDEAGTKVRVDVKGLRDKPKHS
jgi:hypothetical protein